MTLVSCAAYHYQMPSGIAALDVAVARGVAVSLILESAEKLHGGGGAHAYAKYRSYHWPVDRREPPDATRHAKAVIIAGRDVLLTSATMTNAAYDHRARRPLSRRRCCEPGPAPLDALIARGIQPVS